MINFKRLTTINYSIPPVLFPANVLNMFSSALDVTWLIICTEVQQSKTSAAKSVKVGIRCFAIYCIECDNKGFLRQL